MMLSATHGVSSPRVVTGKDKECLGLDPDSVVTVPIV